MFSNQPQKAISDGMDHKLLPIESSTPCPTSVIKEYCIKYAAIFRELTDLLRRVSLLNELFA
jgi:hypothetical protein